MGNIDWLPISEATWPRDGTPFLVRNDADWDKVIWANGFWTGETDEEGEPVMFDGATHWVELRLG